MTADKQDADLAAAAESLLAAHHRDQPLVLANVWDAASAAAVEAAGFAFTATSSRAIAAVLGVPDDDTADPDLIFGWTARIARAVSCPVTADLEAGFGLPPGELVERLLAAGAVGCNLEDTDHHGDEVLVDTERQASYLNEVRAAGDAAGVHVVINARVDAFIRPTGDAQQQLEEAVRRGRRYLEAGADCVYPIAMSHLEQVEAVVAAIPGPVNAMARPGGLPIGELAARGVRRISLASGLHHLVAEHLRQLVTGLAAGRELTELNRAEAAGTA